MRKAQFQFDKRGITVLCNLGHLIDSAPNDKNWAGSSMEAAIAFRHEGDRFDRLATKCQGAGH